MLRLPELNILTPNTLTEALTYLAQPGSTVVAGGTDLYPNIKRRQVKFSTLVSLSRVAALRGISGSEETGVTIGAMTTLTEVINHPLIKTAYPAMAKAASLISTPQLRNSGTLGGNVCLDTRCMYYNQNELWRQGLGHCLKAFGTICQAAPKSSRCYAVSSADTVPVLIALSARLRLQSLASLREIPVEDFFGQDGINYLRIRPGEILTSIVLPPSGDLQTVYLKIRKRQSFDFPVAGAAVALEINSENIIGNARIVLGALESRPLLVEEASEAMHGQKLTNELIETVANLAFKRAKPVDNTDMGSVYRKQMARVLTERCLQQIADNIR